MTALRREEGFTLIELLIVIAILGTLAVVVLLALNPVQQLARTRDAGRVSAVTQLGHAIEAFATTRGGVYPTVDGGAPNCGGTTNWLDCLVSGGEIQTRPATIAASAPGAITCSTGAPNGTQNGFCYRVGAAGVAPAIVFAALESQAQNSRCAGNPNGTVAYAVYSTADSRGGILCRTAAGPALPGVGGYGGGGGAGFLP
jgi:prepilin-type N-terminal cleavage/methylation domain-containing protein